MGENIRILLVDDHDIVRTGLKSFLESQSGFEVVAEASDGSEAVDRALESQPDVIIMDISMPGTDGMEATRQLNANCPNCRILALTVHEDKQYFFEMMKAGATGYITKQSVAEELVAAIEAVQAGQVYLQPTLAGWLLDDYRRLIDQVPENLAAESSSPGLEVLTKRELQVLELVAAGLTTPQIAAELDLSPKTISRHRERIMKKLNMHSSVELIKFAIKTGLIEL
jgi:two-component system, NarL family, response regulator NreC